MGLRMRPPRPERGPFRGRAAEGMLGLQVLRGLPMPSPPPLTSYGDDDDDDEGNDEVDDDDGVEKPLMMLGTCTCVGEAACVECVTVAPPGEDTKARAETELLIPLTVVLLRMIAETEQEVYAWSSGCPQTAAVAEDATWSCAAWPPRSRTSSPDTVLLRAGSPSPPRSARRRRGRSSSEGSGTSMVDVLGALGEHEGLSWEAESERSQNGHLAARSPGTPTPTPTRSGSAVSTPLALGRVSAPSGCLRMAAPAEATHMYDIEEEVSMGFPAYVARVFHYGGCSGAAYVVALIYLVRLLRREASACPERTPVRFTGDSAHRLFMASAVVAAKYLDDHYYSNDHYAKIAGLPLAELNALELDFLFRISFDLRVNPYEYRRVRAYLDAIREDYAARKRHAALAGL